MSFVELVFMLVATCAVPVSLFVLHKLAEMIVLDELSDGFLAVQEACEQKREGGSK